MSCGLWCGTPPKAALSDLPNKARECGAAASLAAVAAVARCTTTSSAATEAPAAGAVVAVVAVAVAVAVATVARDEAAPAGVAAAATARPRDDATAARQVVTRASDTATVGVAAVTIATPTTKIATVDAAAAQAAIATTVVAARERGIATHEIPIGIGNADASERGNESARRAVEARAMKPAAAALTPSAHTPPPRATAAMKRRDEESARGRRVAKMVARARRRRPRPRVVIVARMQMTMKRVVMTAAEVDAQQGSLDKSSERSEAPQSTAKDPKDLKDLRNEEIHDDAKRNVAVAAVTAEQQSSSSSAKDNNKDGVKPEDKDAAPARTAGPLSATSLAGNSSARRSSDDTHAKHAPVHHASATATPTRHHQSRPRGSSDAGEHASGAGNGNGSGRVSGGATPHDHRNGAHGGGGGKSVTTPVRSSSFSVTNPYAPDSKQHAAHAVPSVLDPALEKLRDARRESWRAYLKSNSEFNRAEMKYVALEADLEIAEFWLEMVTTNLEDVGKRIEVHDWNYQKAREQEELE